MKSDKRSDQPTNQQNQRQTKDTEEKPNSKSEMPGLEERIIEIESSDDDSNNYSENTADSTPGLVLRKRNDRDSSSDDNKDHNADSKSDAEPEEWKSRSEQSINFRASPPPTIQISSRDFGDSDSDESSLYSTNKDNVPELAHRYNTLEITTQTDHKPLRLRGGYNSEGNNARAPKPGTIRVKTVDNSLTDDETSQTSEYTTETFTDNTPSYNPMADAPDLDIITPSYQPLHRKNEHWGDSCEPSQVCEGPEFIRIYSQNVNGVSDHKGTMYEQSMKTMKEAEASIFAFNETHGDDLNARHDSLVIKSKTRIFNHTDCRFCQTVT